MISKGCTYGIQAAVYVAAGEQRRFVPIREISRHFDISPHFLTKVLQELTRAGLMRSFRGPNGGVALACPPEALTLRQLVEAVDGGMLFEHCVLGLPDCGTDKPCPLHDKWHSVRGGMAAMLSDVTVHELAERYRTDGPGVLSEAALLCSHPETGPARSE